MPRRVGQNLFSSTNRRSDEGRLDAIRRARNPETWRGNVREKQGDLSRLQKERFFERLQILRQASRGD